MVWGRQGQEVLWHSGGDRSSWRDGAAGRAATGQRETRVGHWGPGCYGWGSVRVVHARLGGLQEIPPAQRVTRWEDARGFG